MPLAEQQEAEAGKRWRLFFLHVAVRMIMSTRNIQNHTDLERCFLEAHVLEMEYFISHLWQCMERAHFFTSTLDFRPVCTLHKKVYIVFHDVSRCVKCSYISQCARNKIHLVMNSCMSYRSTINHGHDEQILRFQRKRKYIMFCDHTRTVWYKSLKKTPGLLYVTTGGISTSIPRGKKTGLCNVEVGDHALHSLSMFEIILICTEYIYDIHVFRCRIGDQMTSPLMSSRSLSFLRSRTLG